MCPMSGMYSLPSHLSQSARDLILRLLVVDPMKRITIPGTYRDICESKSENSNSNQYDDDRDISNVED